MSQQYPDMYADYSTNRSPGSTRGYGGLLNRQASRHFDTYGGQQNLSIYAPVEPEQRYDPPRFDRMAPSTVHSNYPYDTQTWNYGAVSANGGANTMGATGRIKAPSRRAAIPQGWMDSQSMPPPMPSLNLQLMNGGQFNQSHPHTQGLLQRTDTPPEQEELIPTAIVIKNIPFAIKKEQLVQIMCDYGLPLPYAFNYHFDNGVFRGLAFANFTTPEETSAVIERMNHMDLSGRKLRVEYKKMLPAAERDRIERDKRERRGQLQEQHQPIAVSLSDANSLHNQASMNSLNSGPPATSPSPVSSRSTTNISALPDLNDPTTREFFQQLTIFQADASREVLIFPPTVTPSDRRIIHTLAHHMNLEHRSEGLGETRQIQILKTRQNISPPVQQSTISYYNESRRGLNRAATIDFSEARVSDPGYYNHTLGRHTSDLLGIPSSPGLSGLGVHNPHNLRAAKSFADLRSSTPSPARSTASFPVGLGQNISRYAADYGHGHSSGTSGTPTLTPTSARDNQMGSRDDALIATMREMSIGDRPSGTRTNVAGRLGQERENFTSSAGPIGSQRPGNSAFDDTPRNGASAAPERQPRGPGSEWGSGFSRPRQNGHVHRGSGELDLNRAAKAMDDNRAQDSSDRNGTTSRY